MLSAALACGSADGQNGAGASSLTAAQRPNILVIISDDQAHEHTSYAGADWIDTPGFDRIAREGVFFTGMFSATPSCSPTRASLLTGRHFWNNAEASVLAGTFPAHTPTFMDVLDDYGYHSGYTGKGWSPGVWELAGRASDPAGPAYNSIREANPSYLSQVDYAANFDAFLDERGTDQPFVFWMGADEPHTPFARRTYEADRRAQVDVPSWLPDAPVVRDDLLDYASEIEHYDGHVQRMLDRLESTGELDNTIVIVTSDNGMPFPNAKPRANGPGMHVPLAIRWGDAAGQPARQVDTPVTTVDLTATILEAAGVPPGGMDNLAGRSLLGLLDGDDADSPDPDRAVFGGRERHANHRFNNLPYPVRTMRQGDYLLAWHLEPDRPAAGQRELIRQIGVLSPSLEGDVTRTFQYVNQEADPEYFGRLVAQRPAFELFNLRDDPATFHNLADDPAYADVVDRMRRELFQEMLRTGDPRALGDRRYFDTLPATGVPNEYPPFEEIVEWTTDGVYLDFTGTAADVERAGYGMSYQTAGWSLASSPYLRNAVNGRLLTDVDGFSLPFDVEISGLDPGREYEVFVVAAEPNTDAISSDLRFRVGDRDLWYQQGLASIDGAVPLPELTNADYRMFAIRVEELVAEPGGLFSFNLHAGTQGFTGSVALYHTLLDGVVIRPKAFDPGDFDGDGDIDAEDIDALMARNWTFVSKYDKTYDLIDNDVITTDPLTPASDLDELILNLLSTRYGDINLDQRVDRSDLELFALGLASEPIGETQDPGWGQGDFDNNGVADELDLMRIYRNWRFNAPDAGNFGVALKALGLTQPTAIPNPTALLGGLGLMLAGWGRAPRAWRRRG